MLNRLIKSIKSAVNPAAALPDGPVFRSPQHHKYMSALIRGAEMTTDDMERAIPELEQDNALLRAELAQHQGDCAALQAELTQSGFNNA